MLKAEAFGFQLSESRITQITRIFRSSLSEINAGYGSFPEN